MFDRKFIAIFVCLALALPSLVWSAMSSTNYYIYADSVDFGGGTGTSTSFALEDTLGGYATGISTSTSYQVNAGYQSSVLGTLSFVLDGSEINFGNMATAGLVVTNNLNATVNTDSATGYVLSISGVSGTSLASVSDGLVDGAGNVEEYGLAVSGTNSAFANDVAIVDGLVLSSSASQVVSDVTTLSFKAVRSTGSAAGTYSHNITLTASANL